MPTQRSRKHGSHGIFQTKLQAEERPSGRARRDHPRTFGQSVETVGARLGKVESRVVAAELEKFRIDCCIDKRVDESKLGCLLTLLVKNATGARRRKCGLEGRTRPVSTPRSQSD
eukprot:5851033-Pleurochrysis_carterae.AAC.1